MVAELRHFAFANIVPRSLVHKKLNPTSRTKSRHPRWTKSKCKRHLRTETNCYVGARATYHEQGVLASLVYRHASHTADVMSDLLDARRWEWLNNNALSDTRAAVMLNFIALRIFEMAAYFDRGGGLL